MEKGDNKMTQVVTKFAVSEIGQKAFQLAGLFSVALSLGIAFTLGANPSDSPTWPQ